MPRQNLDVLIQENKEQILKWIEEKKSKTWIAQTLHCDRGSFREALKRNGIEYKGQQGGPDYSIQGQPFGNLIALEPVLDRNELSETQQKYKGLYWKCQCIKCKKISFVKGTVLRAGVRLGDGCERSKGEFKIQEILEENNINYKKEFTFSDCIITTNPAKFDFAIFNKENIVEYLIEYDGRQHFEDSFDGWVESQEDFELRQKSDQIKNDYCKEHQIPLIRIPYTHYDNLCLEDLLLNTTSFLLT